MEEELRKIKEELKNKGVDYILLLWLIVVEEIERRIKINKEKRNER